jgi:predicted transcriptional regulator
LKISRESKRLDVFEDIKTHPGTHLREIKRRLNIAMGTVQYHLTILEKEKRIVYDRKGSFKRFYSNNLFDGDEKEILNVLSQEREREILLFLIQNPLTTQKAISEFTNISSSSINWHMKRLNNAGLVDIRHENRFAKYNLTIDSAMVLSLLHNYHPSIWAKWADRLADLMGEIKLPKKEEDP